MISHSISMIEESETISLILKEIKYQGNPWLIFVDIKFHSEVEDLIKFKAHLYVIADNSKIKKNAVTISQFDTSKVSIIGNSTSIHLCKNSTKL